jgi:hypothetical protein
LVSDRQLSKNSVGFDQWVKAGWHSYLVKLADREEGMLQYCDRKEEKKEEFSESLDIDELL